MAADRTVTVDVQDLRHAFEFVSAGDPVDHAAYICLDTGCIYWKSGEAGLEEDDFPADIEKSDRYLAVPDRRELDLGHRLALAFAATELPDDYDTVAGFFCRRGAYRHFKDLLGKRGKLERWYEVENQATDEALLAWCVEHGIQPLADKPES